MGGSLLEETLALVGETTSGPDTSKAFRALALRRLGELAPADGAFFDEIGPRLGEDSPASFRRILEDPRRYGPGYRQTMLKFVPCRPVFSCIATEVYTAREQERLPLFTELLRPEGITSTLYSAVQWGERGTGFIFLVRY